MSVEVPPVARGLTEEDLVGTGGTQAASHYAIVLLALVDVAFGALDAAHNKVTPLSWGSPTEYGGGA